MSDTESRSEEEVSESGDSGSASEQEPEPESDPESESEPEPEPESESEVESEPGSEPESASESESEPEPASESDNSDQNSNDDSDDESSPQQANQDHDDNNDDTQARQPPQWFPEAATPTSISNSTSYLPGRTPAELYHSVTTWQENIVSSGGGMSATWLAIPVTPPRAQAGSGPPISMPAVQYSALGGQNNVNCGEAQNGWEEQQQQEQQQAWGLWRWGEGGFMSRVITRLV